MGRWSELWNEPTQFRPERWMEAPIPSHHHIPFQIGPRVCLGMNFAYMEAQIALSTLFRRFSFEFLDGHSLELLPGLTLRAKYGMQMRVKRRVKSV